MIKRLLLASALIPTAAMLFSAPDAATGADATTAPVPAAARPKQNGQTRPTPGTLTGLVWDYADAITAKNQQEGKGHYVATIGEVKVYYEKVAGSQNSTCQAQYGRWVKFHGYSELLKARRAAEKPVPAGQAEKDAAKAAKAAEKAAAKQAKEDEKAAKKAQVEADKQAKLDAKAAEKAQKEADKVAKAQAKADEKAAKDAAARQATADAAAAAAATAAATTQPDPVPAADTTTEQAG